jgi:methylase of polypeptide subunit release factors
LTPGRALGLGCSCSDDALVTKDISSTALDYAQANAKRREVANRLAFER